MCHGINHNYYNDDTLIYLTMSGHGLMDKILLSCVVFFLLLLFVGKSVKGRHIVLHSKNGKDRLIYLNFHIDCIDSFVGSGVVFF